MWPSCQRSPTARSGPKLAIFLKRTAIIISSLHWKAYISFPKAALADSFPSLTSTEHAHKSRNTLLTKEAHAVSTWENTSTIYLVTLIDIFKINSLFGVITQEVSATLLHYFTFLHLASLANILVSVQNPISKCTCVMGQVGQLSVSKGAPLVPIPSFPWERVTTRIMQACRVSLQKATCANSQPQSYSGGVTLLSLEKELYLKKEPVFPFTFLQCHLPITFKTTCCKNFGGSIQGLHLSVNRRAHHYKDRFMCMIYRLRRPGASVQM